MSERVFITGVSSGIGAGLAAYYLRAGWEVLGCSRREPSHLIGQSNFHFVSCDLSRFDQVPAAMEKLFEGTDRCDLAVLNSGVLSPFGDMQSVTIEQCQQVMAVNVWSNKAILDWLLPSPIVLRQVVTISSGAAVNGNRGWNAYSISKAALNMLTLLYAREAPETHFTALAPGLVDTAMQEELCNLPRDGRYPTLETLRSKRGTADMPDGDQLAPRLAEVFTELPKQVESGEFVDIRKLPWLKG